jgi:hypothetical protein
MFFSITVTVMKLEGQGIEVASCFVQMWNVEF